MRPEKDDGQKLLNLSTLVVKTVFAFMLAGALFIFIYYGSMDSLRGIPKEPVSFIESWTVVEADGNEFTTGRSYNAEKDYPEDFTIISRLPQNVQDNYYLCFGTGKNVAVYINGELRKDYVEKRDVAIPGGSVKRFFMLVPLYAKDSGAEVKLVRESTTKRGQIVPETIVGSLGGIKDYMMDNYGLSFILAVMVLIFSIIVVIVSVVMKFRSRRRYNMLYGALATCIIAAWVITNSMYFPFVFDRYHIDGVMNYFFCLMIPFGLALYLNSIQRARYKKCMSVLMIISTINALIWPSLHFSGIFPLYSALPFITVTLAALSVAAIAILVVDAVRGNIGEYKYTAIGFIGFLACGIFEVISLLFMTPKYEELPMVIGLAFFLVFVVIQQVDDLRKINIEKQKALDLSEAKSHFLANMSHEIRTPINAVIGMDEMILRESSEPEIISYAEDIKSASRTLLSLINDVLDFSKIESGKMDIVPAKYDTAEMVEDLVNMISDRAEKKSLTLKTEIDEKLPSGLYGDDVKLRQVITNLLTNAVKYTEKGSVTLIIRGEEVSEEGCTLYVEVKDTGIGIRKEDMEKLFQSFRRLDERKNRTIEGTGLGMSIVDGILKLMDSSIEIESEYGVGSSFSFRVKQGVTDLTPMGDFRRHTKKKETGPVRNLIIKNADLLIVDDNQMNLKVTASLMKKLRVTPDLASSGREAIDMVRGKHYDIIFMDHMMPEMDGIETLQEIKAGKLAGEDTTVIALTANAISGAREMYLSKGFADYLSKPIKPDDLEHMLAEYLPEDRYYYEEATAKEPEPGSQELAGEESSGLEELLDKMREQGFNAEAAEGFVMGDEAILLEFLTGFVDTEEEKRSLIDRYYSDKDWKNYEIQVHALKGLARTIGADGLADMALELELAAEKEDVTVIEGHHEEMVAEYSSVTGRVKAIIGDAKPSVIKTDDDNDMVAFEFFPEDEEA